MATPEEQRELTRIREHLKRFDVRSTWCSDTGAIVVHPCDVTNMSDSNRLCVCDPCDCTSDACRTLCHAPRQQWLPYVGGGVWMGAGMVVIAADLLEPIAAQEILEAEQTRLRIPVMREAQIRFAQAVVASRKIFDANGQNVTAP